MRKLIAALFAASTLTLGLAGGTASAHNADLPCNIPVPADATVVSPGKTDCIVQYATLGDAAKVVHESMVEGDDGLIKYVYPADDFGFIAKTTDGYVVRVADTSPFVPLEVIVGPA